MQQLATMAIIRNCTASAIKDAAKSLIVGNLVAFPTETVYGLGADATNEKAVARIYKVKGRPIDHPIIVHISSMNNLDKWAIEVPDYAIKLASNFWPGPMTLILPRSILAKNYITGNQNNIGIRIPAHTGALALLKEFEYQGGSGIAAPSANRFGKLSPTCAEDVKMDLSNYLNDYDLILDGGSCLVGVESTIINCTQTQPTILRPGGITAGMINDLLGIRIEIVSKNTEKKLKTPGNLESHYSPIARVYISGTPSTGDGYLALAKFKTPPGVFRLASPMNTQEYANVLYKALRFADKNKIENVYVELPEGDDLSIAICDRLQKCSYKPKLNSFSTNGYNKFK